MIIDKRTLLKNITTAIFEETIKNSKRLTKVRSVSDGHPFKICATFCLTSKFLRKQLF